MKDATIVPYTLLALEVILHAIGDATKDIGEEPPELDGRVATIHARHHWNNARRDRDGAREFLTTSNEDLLFWCRVAGLDHRVLLHYAKGAATDWGSLRERLSKYRRHTKPEGLEESESAA